MKQTLNQKHKPLKVPNTLNNIKPKAYTIERATDMFKNKYDVDINV